MIKAVVFDLDGVIADTPKVYFRLIREFLAGMGLRYTEEDFAGQIGAPFRVKVEWMNKRFGVEIPFEEYMKAVKVKSIDIFRRELEPNPGLTELIRMLKKNSFMVAVASNNSRESVDAILKKLSLHETFDAVVELSQVKKPKPDPEVYLASARRLSLPPRCCLAVEDTGIGVSAAKAAGMKCIAMPNPLDLHGDFSGADAVVGSLGEITLGMIRALGD